MSRMICIVVMILLIVPCFSNAETIDVQIKGIDDSVKTTKQLDYKEAVLFAKHEAIERAGVKIKSMTSVKDFVLNADYIESKAEGVLLPGYDIVDMGYAEDGTYQVVLVGKIAVAALVKGKKMPETESVAATTKETLSGSSSRARESDAGQIWEDVELKIVVEKVFYINRCLVGMLEFTNKSNGLLFLDVDEYSCHMYDETGNKWRYDQFKDTARLWAGEKLAAGSSIKSKMSFCSSSSRSPAGNLVLFIESQSDYAGRYPFVARVKGIKVD